MPRLCVEYLTDSFACSVPKLEGDLLIISDGYAANAEIDPNRTGAPWSNEIITTKSGGGRELFEHKNEKGGSPYFMQKSMKYGPKGECRIRVCSRPPGRTYRRVGIYLRIKEVFPHPASPM